MVKHCAVDVLDHDIYIPPADLHLCKFASQSKSDGRNSSILTAPIVAITTYGGGSRPDLFVWQTLDVQLGSHVRDDRLADFVVVQYSIRRLSVQLDAVSGSLATRN